MPARKPNPAKPKSIVIDNRLHYITLDAVEVVAPLNLKRPQMVAYDDMPDDPSIEDLYHFLDVLIGQEASNSLGVLDVADFAGRWSEAFAQALGGSRGESVSSSVSSPTTEGLSATTSGDSSPGSVSASATTGEDSSTS